MRAAGPAAEPLTGGRTEQEKQQPVGIVGAVVFAAISVALLLSGSGSARQPRLQPPAIVQALRLGPSQRATLAALQQDYCAARDTLSEGADARRARQLAFLHGFEGLLDADQREALHASSGTWLEDACR
jgi:hypothetical protein